MIFLSIMYIQIQFLLSLANSTIDLQDKNQTFKCRNEIRMHRSYDEYKLETCARCYYYIPPQLFKVKFRITSMVGMLRDPISNKTYYANPLNTSKELLESFADESLILKWKTCCMAALECCEHMLKPPEQNPNHLYCPRTWDGWQCWDDTLAGTTAKQPCQPHIYVLIDPPSCTKYAYKECWDNGTWYLNGHLREWTNYTKCGQRDVHRMYLYFHITMYSISVVSIVPALVIFSAYKQLQVHRITMHKNLFLSLFLNGVAVLLFKSIVILDEFNRSPTYVTIMKSNGGACKFLSIMTRYFRMTNFMWMFCEGFYLHKLIAAAFAEQKTLIMFYIIGWVVPIIPSSIYATLRKTMDDEKCWAFPAGNFEWIMNAPNMTSLLINFFFLCNIIRVLVTKLRATHSNEPSQYRKAVRATIILVPLFGLQFIFVIYRPQSGVCTLMEAYTYFSHAIDGLQGFMVSLIFCYMNGEVMYLLKRTYQRYQLSHRFRSQNSIMLNPVSVTQFSTMGESNTNGQQGLHYRSKAVDRKNEVFSNMPDKTNNHKNTTAV